MTRRRTTVYLPRDTEHRETLQAYRFQYSKRAGGWVCNYTMGDDRAQEWAFSMRCRVVTQAPGQAEFSVDGDPRTVL